MYFLWGWKEKLLSEIFHTKPQLGFMSQYWGNLGILFPQGLDAVFYDMTYLLQYAVGAVEQYFMLETPDLTCSDAYLSFEGTR